MRRLAGSIAVLTAVAPLALVLGPAPAAQADPICYYAHADGQFIGTWTAGPQCFDYSKATVCQVESGSFDPQIFFAVGLCVPAAVTSTGEG